MTNTVTKTVRKSRCEKCGGSGEGRRAGMGGWVPADCDPCDGEGWIPEEIIETTTEHWDTSGQAEVSRLAEDYGIDNIHFLNYNGDTVTALVARMKEFMSIHGAVGDLIVVSPKCFNYMLRQAGHTTLFTENDPPPGGRGEMYGADVLTNVEMPDHALMMLPDEATPRIACAMVWPENTFPAFTRLEDDEGL